MDVQIISTEAIKPSSPSKKHVKSYKLSLFDQLFSHIYMPFVFFYSAKHQDFRKNSDLLKESLSRTLNHYYPFAGRFDIDSFSVDCNDHGAAFIEAHVNDDISKFLQPPKMELLQQLIPSMLKIFQSEISSRELLLVQVNYFNNGGEMAIGVCFWHGVADGWAICNFMKLWGDITRRGEVVNNAENDEKDDDICNNVVLDCSSLFPPQTIQQDHHLIKPQLSPNLVFRRLLFDGKKIASLKEKMNKGEASRFAVVSALIWGASSMAALNYTMSLRGDSKVFSNDPPINRQCIGNIFRFVRAEWSADDEEPIEVTGLAREVMKAKRLMGRSKVVDSIEYLDFVKGMNEEWDDLRSFNVSSLIGMPFYEVDFGWGKPVWFSIVGVVLQNFSVVCSTSDGEGIEAWVMMLKEDMDKFEQDPNILTYSSSNPSIFLRK